MGYPLCVKDTLGRQLSHNWEGIYDRPKERYVVYVRGCKRAGCGIKVKAVQVATIAEVEDWVYDYGVRWEVV